MLVDVSVVVFAVVVDILVICITATLNNLIVVKFFEIFRVRKIQCLTSSRLVSGPHLSSKAPGGL